jgi:hypothetical protein
MFLLFYINSFCFILHQSLFTFTQQKNSPYKERGGEGKGVIKRGHKEEGILVTWLHAVDDVSHAIVNQEKRHNI